MTGRPATIGIIAERAVDCYAKRTVFVAKSGYAVGDYRDFC